MIRSKIVDILIKLLLREIGKPAPEVLTKEQYDGLLSNLWQNPAFRKYVQDRDAKIIFMMAGSEGMKPEPRDAYVMHTGQRVELLILAREAKAAWTRVEGQHKKEVVS